MPGIQVLTLAAQDSEHIGLQKRKLLNMTCWITPLQLINKNPGCQPQQDPKVWLQSWLCSHLVTLATLLIWPGHPEQEPDIPLKHACTASEEDLFGERGRWYSCAAIGFRWCTALWVKDMKEWIHSSLGSWDEQTLRCQNAKTLSYVADGGLKVDTVTYRMSSG